MNKSLASLFFVCLILSFPVKAQTAKSSALVNQMLDLPAPKKFAAETETKSEKERSEEFYEDENVPPDDAPIEDVLAYWAKKNEEYSRTDYSVKPSDRTAERILEQCEDNPELLNQYLAVLPTDPKIAERVKRIYDRMKKDSEAIYQRNGVREWLKYNSNYYVDELIRAAQQIKDNNEYVQNEDQAVLRALAKVDWNAARSIIDRLENDSSQPYSAILAKWVVYRHAVETGDTSIADSYRRRLQDIVENKTASWAMRDLAMDALVMVGDFEGRDEWYLSLLEDETLLTIQENNYTGLTTLISMSPKNKWTEKMIELTQSANPAVRSAAVRNLIEGFDGKRKDVLQALLPWLNDPAWAKGSSKEERMNLIAALGKIEVPEAIPSLIALVMNDEESRTAAANALTLYKDSRAIPALKFALAKEPNISKREIYINALLASGGFSDDEQMAALEAFVTLTSTPEGLEKFQEQSRNYYEDYYDGEDEENEREEKPSLPVEISVGNVISEQTEPSEGLVMRAIARHKVLQKTNPVAAAALSLIMQKWKSRAFLIENVRQIKTGEADLETILSFLAKRAEIREKIPNELFVLRGASGLPRAIGACVLENENESLSVLGQPDAETKIAFLGCARLIRAALPVREVGAYLNSENPLLALAARRYLEAEDSVEARTILLGKYPSETLILGARNAFIPNEKNVYDTPALDALFESVTGRAFVNPNAKQIANFEESLRAEMRETPDLIAVYSLMPQTDSGQKVVRVYRDKIHFTDYEDPARYRERFLTSKEYEDFYRFLTTSGIDGMVTSNAVFGEGNIEFVMFGRGGGRRVFFHNTYYQNEILQKLFEHFGAFSEGDLKIKYRLADKIKGLEVVLSDKNLKALSVWKNGADLRVLISDENKLEEIRRELNSFTANPAEIDIDNPEAMRAKMAEIYAALQKRQEELKYTHLNWFSISGGKTGAMTTQPADAPMLYDATQMPENEELNPMPRAWKVRVGNSEIRTGRYYSGKLFRVSRSQPPALIKEGQFLNPVVSGDGRWAVVTKANGNWYQPKEIARINLQSGKEFKVNLPPADNFYAVSFLSAHNKILLYRGAGRTLSPYEMDSSQFTKRIDYETDVEETVEEETVEQKNDKSNPSPKVPEYYLLDAATGAVNPVKGEFRPLEQQTYRPLQPTNNPNEFWAAIFDAKTKTTEIGRYNTSGFKFQPVLKVPEIALDSMDIWVDEKEAKVYFVYQSHLLALPFKQIN
ncbi:hypothetical protein BH20ACI4_BH20ACI4_04180 [soil metagenome]